MIQSGMMDAWKKQFWPKASRCIGSAAQAPIRAINFLDIAGALLLVTTGLLISIVVFLLELLAGRTSRGTGGG